MKPLSVLRAMTLAPRIKGKWAFVRGRPYRFGSFECPDRYCLRQFFPDYEREVTAAIIEEAERSDGLFVDVGANIGIHSVTAGKLGMKVLAIEPNSQAFAFLRRNLDRNVVKAEALNAAAWSSSGILRFHPAGHSDIGTVYDLDMEGHSVEEGYDIRAVVLDEVLSGREPALIKIDTEGCEPEVIKGAISTLKAKMPAVVFEALTSERLSQCSALLAPLGYYVAPISERNYLAEHR